MSELRDDKIIEKRLRCPLCYAVFARVWSPSRQIHIFACHFCKVAIAETDPFVGRWEELTVQGTAPCPNCDTTMRAFWTSTGYKQLRCPKKNCQARIESSSPDRKADTQLFGADGEPLQARGIDRPITTPDDLGPTQ